MKAAFHSLLIVIVDRENPNVQHLYFQSYKVKGPITKRLIDFYNGSCTYSKFWDLSTYCDTDWYYFFHRSSDGIHDKQTKCDLTESETTYCHHAIWPFLRTVLKFLDVPENMAYNFKIGETPLSAKLGPDDTTYKADGTILLEKEDVEILLLEATGPYSKRDLSKHACDYVKGSFGCTAMLKTILRKYKCADPQLLETLSVLFLQTSGKGTRKMKGMKDTFIWPLLTSDILHRRLYPSLGYATSCWRQNSYFWKSIEGQNQYQPGGQNECPGKSSIFSGI